MACVCMLLMISPFHYARARDYYEIDSKSHTFWQLVGAYGRNAENVVKTKQNEGSTKAPAGTGRNEVTVYSKTL